MNKYLSANIVFSKFARDYMELKRDLPIRPSEMAVISIITRRSGNFTPLMLAEMIGVSKPMIAAHIRVLLKKGYIFKEPSGEDKRSFFVRPTEKGKLLANEFEAKQTKCLKKIEAGLGEAEFDELVRLLDKAETEINEMKGV